MPRDLENNKKWRKENFVRVTLNLLRSTDRDIIDYLDREGKKGNSKQGVIKTALREKMNREGKE